MAAWRARWLGLVMVSATACGGPPPGDDASTPMVCAADLDCDDGRFCNGPERCDPASDASDARGCVSTPPCMDTQRCLEEEDRCVTSCAVNADADGDGIDAIECGGADCDDTDPNRYPGNVEVCDDAGHDEDCNPTTFGARDADGDGHVDAACCNTDTGGTTFCGDDCNDQRRDARPGNTEACEGVDNDCDGMIDEGLLVLHYRDADFDLHGVADDTREVCPGTPGWSLVSDDCDDTSPVRHGAQLEICDGVDNDCDGTIDESPVAVSWYPDEDGDGFGAVPASGEGVVISCAPVAGYSTRSSDCDDTDANVRPGQREICNGIDDDCNGRADAGALGSGDFEDDDQDGFADVTCGGSDCNDADAAINPSAAEICNGVDDDCDALVDGADAMALWYLDRDRDGWGDSGAPAIESCEPQPGRVLRGGDCNDDRADIHPRVADLCDGVDADCDGEIDENGVRFAFYPDADGDGWGTSALGSVVFRCSAPAGTTERTGDCADTDPARHPGALETCDSVDEDCDGVVDEDADRMWYVDSDRDGHGVGTGILSCTPIAGRAPIGDDCDDADGGRFPGNTEICDGADDDCDASVDEGAASSCDAPNATGVCTAGVCSLVCATGYGDCDDVLATGCEVDVRRSATDCGACGVTCGLADACGRSPAAPGTCNASEIVELTGQEDYVIGRRATGGTFGWGFGAHGQHLLGSTTDTPQPGRGQLDEAVQLAAGDGLGCAVLASGAVVCWGSNAFGALGFGATSPSSRTGAGLVLGLPGPAAATCASVQHACAVLRDGTAHCWGSQLNGRLGNGLTASASVPTPVPVLSAPSTPVTDAIGLSCGETSTCFLRERAPGDRYVSCTGSNGWGELGRGSTSPSESGFVLDVVGLPSDLLAMGRGLAPAHCVITTTGRAYCWGNNGSPTGNGFSLGLGATAPSTQPSPVTPPGLDANVVDLMIHNEGGCAIKRNGAARELWCWGYGATPSWLGDGSTGHVNTPTLVGPTADRFTDVSAMMAGFQFLCAVRTGNQVWCIGADVRGQLGDGLPLTYSGAPVRALGLP